MMCYLKQCLTQSIINMKQFLLVFLILFLGIKSYSQDTLLQDSVYSTVIQIHPDTLKVDNEIRLLQDSIKLLRDSISLNYAKNDTLRNGFREKTEKLIGSMFGESKQLSNADSLIKVFDALPSFGIYKDNYIVVGTELFKKSTEWNSDAKFQVSIRQRLTNSTLPFKTYLFITYTQKAFWDIFRESFPFRDLNFNPTLGIGRALIHNNRFMGFIDFQIEHESNGKDGDASRSWNKISFGSLLTFNDKWALQTKLWIPIVDGGYNKNIVSYSGYGLMALSYQSPRRKYNASCVVTKRSGAFFDANVTLNFSVRLFSDDNQFLFVEYYNGYGESMLEFNRYRQRVRAGIVIKPNFFSIY